MGRLLAHLLGTMGLILMLLLWLSLLVPLRADQLVNKIAGPQHEYKIVLGAAMLSSVLSLVAAICGAKWWYLAAVLSVGTLGFFTFTLLS